MKRLFLRFKRLGWGVVSVTFLVLVGVSFLSTPKAQALSSLGPDPTDFTGGVTEGFAVTSPNTPFSTVPNTDVKLYFKTPGTKIIKIIDGNMCVPGSGAIHDAQWGNYRWTYGDDGDLAFVDNSNWQIGDVVDNYWVTSSNSTTGATYTSATVPGVFVNSKTDLQCSNQSVNLSVDVNATNWEQSVGYYVGIFHATGIVSGPGGSSGSQNIFEVQLPDNNDVVGYDSTLAASQFGIYRRTPGKDDIAARYNNWNVLFGSPCFSGTEQATGSEYDDDNGDANQSQPMYNELRAQKPTPTGYQNVPNNVALTWVYKPTPQSQPIPVQKSQNPNILPRYWPGPDPNSYYVYSGNQRTVYMTFTAGSNYHYDWYWHGVNYNNLVDFEVPFDSIYANVTCPVTTVTCNTNPISTQPTIVQPNANFSARAGVTYTGQAPQDPSFHGTFNGQNFTASATLSGNSLNFTANLRAPPPPPGTSTMTWQLYSNGQPVPNAQCSGPISVFDLPYVSAYGADVRAGGEFASLGGVSTGCVGAGTSGSSTSGVIGAWFDNATGDYGAGAQLSAIAMVKIVGFASAQTVANRGPTDLTFSNTGAITPDDDSPSLDGNFANPSFCLPEPQAPSTPQALPVSGNFNTTGANGAYSNTGTPPNPPTLTINPGGAGTVGNGKNVSIFVNGDVYIANNIVYGPSSAWILSPSSNIPSFVLVATGNIFIAPNVTELDGLYVAKNDSASDQYGHIYTCANGLASLVQPQNLYGPCDKQLTVYGGFIADEIDLMRTYGTLEDGASTPPAHCTDASASPPPVTPPSASRPTCGGEVFDFSPEMFLSNPAVAPTNGGAPTYNSIVSLPPVL